MFLESKEKTVPKFVKISADTLNVFLFAKLGVCEFARLSKTKELFTLNSLEKCPRILRRKVEQGKSFAIIYETSRIIISKPVKNAI